MLHFKRPFELALHYNSNTLVPAALFPGTSNEKRWPQESGTPNKLPSCAVCGADSTGIHFGADTCAACSAFFRRTVALDKRYGCQKGGKHLNLKTTPGIRKCKSCRFTRCIQVGMDKNSVQLRRDAIGKYSNEVKRKVITPDTAGTSNGFVTASPSLSSLADLPHLNGLISAHSLVNYWRKMIYSDRNCEGLFDEAALDLKELENVELCLLEIYKMEIGIAGGYIDSLEFLNVFDKAEKAKLHRNFFVVRQAIEEPYLTWKYGGLQKNWWVMQNRRYIDIDNADKYFTSGIMQKLEMSYKVAKNLFEGSLKCAMADIGIEMRSLHISEVELCLLLGIALLDPAVATLTPESKEKVWELRNILLRESFAFYATEHDIGSSEQRMGSLLMLLSVIKAHSVKTAENMQLINTFQLFPCDSAFKDICRGNFQSDQNL